MRPVALPTAHCHNVVFRLDLVSSRQPTKLESVRVDVFTFLSRRVSNES